MLQLPAARMHELLLGAQLGGWRLPTLDPEHVDILAPCESQEVWAAGMTYSRRAAEVEQPTRDIYRDAYEADVPALFFKAAGWRVRASGQTIGIRGDSEHNTTEPELAVLCNRAGEVVALGIGNDVGSRSIEAANPLYLAQAKVYDGSCAIGPAAVLVPSIGHSRQVVITIRRHDRAVFEGRCSTADLVRRPEDLAAVLRAAYSLPAGAWLLTGTGISLPDDVRLAPGDEVEVTIEGLGRLRNVVETTHHSGARALPKWREPT